MQKNVFNEAHAARDEVLSPGTIEAPRPAVRTILPLLLGSTLGSTAGAAQQTQQADLPGGTVAAVLSTCLETSSSSVGQSCIELAASLPRAVRLGPPISSNNLGNEDQSIEDAGSIQAEESMLRMLTGIKVTATMRGLYPTRYNPSSPALRIVLHNSSGTEKTFKLSSSTEMVLFQPSLVATVPEIRDQAEATCFSEVESSELGAGGGGAGGALRNLLEAVQSAGHVGLTISECAANMDPLGTSNTAAVDQVVGLLCKYGLVRRVSGYDDVKVMASGASQSLMAFPPPKISGKKRTNNFVFIYIYICCFKYTVLYTYILLY